MTFGAVIGGGAGAVVLLVMLFVWWRGSCSHSCIRKFGAGQEQYGRFSIDHNFQYGEKQDYYHYHNDKKQTRVIDENEMYENYEHE